MTEQFAHQALEQFGRTRIACNVASFAVAIHVEQDRRKVATKLDQTVPPASENGEVGFAGPNSEPPHPKSRCHRVAEIKFRHGTGAGLALRVFKERQKACSVHRVRHLCTETIKKRDRNIDGFSHSVDDPAMRVRTGWVTDDQRNAKCGFVERALSP